MSNWHRRFIIFQLFFDWEKVCLSARIVREADDASAVTPTAVPATTQATLPAVTPASAANKTTDAEVKLENSDEEFEKQKKEIFDIIPKEYVTEIDAVFTRVLAGKTGDDKALARVSVIWKCGFCRRPVVRKKSCF